MHGRLRIPTLAAALVTALTVVAPATPAAADETLALGDSATVDGVVTQWTPTGVDGQTVRLRSRQALGGGGTATTGETDPAVAAAGTPIPARLAIGAGGTLALIGASGGAPAVSARVEPDADGDGYGDTTQDSCPADASTHAGACPGTATVGSPLTLRPDPGGLSASGNAVQAYQLSAAGTIGTIPRDGVIVRWRVRVEPGLGDTVLQLLRPTTPGGSTFTVVAETAPIHATTTDVLTLAASVPARQGDRLAVRSTLSGANRDLGAIAYVAGDDLVVNDPPKTTGQTWTPDASSPAARRLLVQADVEPDADGDGRGDITQNSADLQLTAQAADSFSHVYTIKNLGPGTSYGVALTFAATNNVPFIPPAGVTCTQADTTCRIGKLSAGASLSLSPMFAVPTIYPYSATLTSSATAAAITPDPNHANDGPLSLSTFYTTGGTVTPPPPTGLCANVIRGTRDDDVLRGTVFADRLVGNDGNDLLKGGGGDDCLEGGAGADVLDGGDGNDRLSGSSGRDRLIGGRGADSLKGGKGDDRLSGGSGNDTLSPGAGHDAIDGGAGNDIINSVDGVRETVICGPGKDTVRADRRDVLRGCEKVTRKK